MGDRRLWLSGGEDVYKRQFKADEIMYVGLQGLHPYQERFLREMGVDHKIQTVSYTHLEQQQEEVTVEEEQQRSLFKEPALWLLGLSTLCCFFNCYGMYAYLAQYLYLSLIHI